MNDEKRMSLGDHLEELRTRLIICLAAVVIGFFICLIFKNYILRIINIPLLHALEEFDTPRKLKIKNISDPIILSFQISLIFGIIIASPVIFWQLWKFVCAGLYAHERRYVRIFAPFSLILFLAGVAFCYYMMARFGIRFLLSMAEKETSEPDIDIRRYPIDFMKVSLAMGLAFQLPLVMMFLIKSGIVGVEIFQKQRRIAILLICITSAILTPPDPFTMILMVVPLLVLYELGIVLGRVTFRKKSA